MGYTAETWKNRIAERTDLSTAIVHLTRSLSTKKSDGIPTLLDNLFKILDAGIIKPSSTAKGFIVGSRPAVCFQDAPLVGIVQNVFYEQKYRAKNTTAKLRYQGAGIAFGKPYAFRKGARPVIYDKREDAKQYLPEDEYWRIVNLDLEDDSNYIDWTHEREWRSPGAFEFDIAETILLFPNWKFHQNFVKRCNAENKDYVERVKGIVMMGAVLF